MLIWIFLLIPLVGSIVVYHKNREAVTHWEAMIPFAVCFLSIGITKILVEKSQVDDTEYLGSNIVEARYYEYWETYVRRTCTRSCGKNCTTTYDCSYCDEHPEHWTVVNSMGQEFPVSEDYYNFLKKKWNSVPTFFEMNRDINNSFFGCGRDGDMYYIKWDGKESTSESTTTKKTYENRVKAARNSFDFVKVTEEEKNQYELYDYPEVKGIKQTTVLGLDKVKWLGPNQINGMAQSSDYLNGYLGPLKKCRIYYLFFVDKPPMASNMQEAYWEGGNDNELVICIGLSKGSSEIKWVRPFSWSKNRMIIPSVREDIMGMKNFDYNLVRGSVFKNVLMHFERRNFKEFSYITVDPPFWSYIFVFIITSLITYGVCYWIINNEIEP